MEVFSRISNFIRSITNILLTIWGTLSTFLILINLDKFNFELKPDISIFSLLNTRIGLLCSIFFLTSIVMSLLRVLGIKTFSINFVDQYIYWFFTSLLATVTYIVSNFSWNIYTTMKKKLPLDVLLENEFINVYRNWTTEDLLKFLNQEVLKYKEIKLSDKEVMDLIVNSKHKVKELICQTRIICEQKLQELSKEHVDIFMPNDISKWSWIFDSVKIAGNFIVDHKIAIFVLCTGVFVWFGLQNWFFQNSTHTALSQNQSLVENVNAQASNLDGQTELLNESVVNLTKLVNTLVETHSKNAEDFLLYCSNLANDLSKVQNAIEILQEGNILNTDAIKLAFKILEAAELLPPGLELTPPVTEITQNTNSPSSGFVPFSGVGYRLRTGSINFESNNV